MGSCENLGWGDMLTRGGFLGKEPARGEVSSLRFSQSHRHMSGKIGVRKRGARCHPFASLRAGSERELWICVVPGQRSFAALRMTASGDWCVSINLPA